MISRIVLADDHPIVRQGLRTLLESQPEFQVVGEAENGLTAISLVEQLKPDILILDIMMPGLNGLEVVKRVRQNTPQTQVVVLSLHSNEPYVLEALRSGAAAYVLKASSNASLIEAVKAVSLGRHYLSPPLSERAIELYIEQANGGNEPEEDGYTILTTREREVFQLIAEGLSNAQVGEKLTISPRTAETHRTNIMRKLHLHNENELVRYAIQRGVIAGE
ncbi:MAG: response regulator transcription factor [Chloroflexi bacterium]|nr:response regulator transcription factor [Chloroflexota bacterium]OJW04117.1 MAG: DNA-binding response regulator [Chloroflexi bacterium 54-19]